MYQVAAEIGPAGFAQARAAERARRSEQKRREKAAALEALHEAREAFRVQAADVYATGAAAADRDGDRLEDLAGRLIDWLQALEPAFESLEVACDRAHYRGPVVTRLRPPFDAGGLAQAVAEAVGGAALSDHAGAVLVAAVRRAAAP